MRKYLYKNIILFQTCGAWQADYADHENGVPRHAISRQCATTKRKAYILAKQDVDYMNENRR